MKERQHFLDILRVAATCAVVLLHTVTGVMDNTNMEPYPQEQKIFLAVKDLACWCVPVFLLISGYLFLDTKKELTFGKMIHKYCRRVILALFLFGIPYAWIEMVATEGSVRWSMFGQSIVRVLRGESWAHMWYLYLIFFLYLLTPAIKWALIDLPKAALYIILALLLVGSSILPFLKEILELSSMWVLPGDSIYLFYYLCGYLFAEKKEYSAKKGHLLWGMAMILAAGMVFSRAVGFSVQMAYNYPFTVLLSLCLFGAGLAKEQNWGCSTALWRNAAELSFAIYLIHPVFLNLFYKYFKVTPLSFNVVVSLPLFFIGTVILSGACAWILRKVPLLRKYVL